MSNYTYADLFDKSASKKEITIETEDKSVKITNSEIHFEQFELKEILCDDDYLTFGQCNASQLKFKISNVFTSILTHRLFSENTVSFPINQQMISVTEM